ncbi:T-complex protein 1 subunit delta [Bienertia sinuspersici]
MPMAANKVQRAAKTSHLGDSGILRIPKIKDREGTAAKPSINLQPSFNVLFDKYQRSTHNSGIWK